ncbi:hypothetical protein L2E82_37405 [Cichorium intybus]|uniref:Uncharacterized protein n=1 Tax=Cichorium intybus TaxID=13427 RepID=A0ACB9AF19_CICIN|nr:hypothetical protein L2E82_37405 [Cichorium intybus]
MILKGRIGDGNKCNYSKPLSVSVVWHKSGGSTRGWLLTENGRGISSTRTEIQGTLFFDVFIPLEDLKSDWSIMKAYEALQKKGEDDNEDSGNFTPFPVEVLGLM